MDYSDTIYLSATRLFTISKIVNSQARGSPFMIRDAVLTCAQKLT